MHFNNYKCKRIIFYNYLPNKIKNQEMIIIIL